LPNKRGWMPPCTTDNTVNPCLDLAAGLA
jgi:hypothetical protein